MRGTTYHAIFALLYGLGLRVGEAARLRVEDVDGERALLFIHKSKFSKDRLVPFGPRLAAVLRAYLQEKQRRLSGYASGHDPLFSFARNRMMHPGTISQTFLNLTRKLQLEVPPGVRSPRAHDLRHSFAVGTLLRWYRSGTDPGRRLLALSTFLGHVDVSSTAVYLTMTSALLEEARQRYEAHATPLVLEESEEVRP
jgi:integrase